MSLAVDKSSSQKVKILGDTGLVHLHVWGKKKLLVTQKRYYLFIDKNSRDHIKAFDIRRPQLIILKLKKLKYTGSERKA